MDSALIHNGYLSRMCHQVYEQQIANLKNDMSLAIQINPMNYTSAYLPEAMARPNAGLVFLARLFSDRLNVNMAAHLSAACLFGPKKNMFCLTWKGCSILDFSNPSADLT